MACPKLYSLTMPQGSPARNSKFLKANGIRHVLTPPYHPSSSGLVERAVQTLKGGLKKHSDGSIDMKPSQFLFAYRSMPHTGTGVSPAEHMFGRRLHTPLDNLRLDMGKKVWQQQEMQKSTHDRWARPREFVLGDLVSARDYSTGSKWLPGKVSKTLGSAMFEVQLTDMIHVGLYGDMQTSWKQEHPLQLLPVKSLQMTATWT